MATRPRRRTAGANVQCRGGRVQDAARPSIPTRGSRTSGGHHGATHVAMGRGRPGNRDMRPAAGRLPGLLCPQGPRRTAAQRGASPRRPRSSCNPGRRARQGSAGDRGPDVIRATEPPPTQPRLWAAPAATRWLQPEDGERAPTGVGRRRVVGLPSPTLHGGVRPTRGREEHPDLKDLHLGGHAGGDRDDGEVVEWPAREHL